MILNGGIVFAVMQNSTFLIYYLLIMKLIKFMFLINFE